HGRGEAAAGGSVREAVHRRQARPGAPVIEPARDESAASVPDVRVGSATNAVRPILAAERSLAAGPAQWTTLLLVAGAALFADQLTKQVIARTLDVGQSVDIVGPL